MGVYIKDMEMPDACCACPCARHLECVVTEHHPTLDEWYEEKPSWCPLVPAPSHGDLIEESKVLDIVFEWCPDDDGSVGKDGDLREMLDEIEALPTIIPADEEDEMDSFIHIFKEDDEEDEMDSFIRFFKD